MTLEGTTGIRARAMVVVGIGLGERPEIFRSQALQGLVMGGYVRDVARRERIAESYPDSWLDEEPRSLPSF